MRRALGIAFLIVGTPAAFAGTTSIQVREDGMKVIMNEPSEARSRRLCQIGLLATPDPLLAEAIDRHARARDLRAACSGGGAGRVGLGPCAFEQGRHRPDAAHAGDGQATSRSPTPGMPTRTCAAAPLLRQMIDRFGTSSRSGRLQRRPGGGSEIRRDPALEETRNYVRRILHLFDGSGGDGAQRPGVFIVRDANNRVRLTASSVARP